jgi:hypothetical protein
LPLLGPLLGLLFVLVFGACRVDVSVGVDVDDHGGGEVRARARLDPSAVVELGPSPEERIRLDDLEAAGWDIEGPTVQDDGGLEVTATHGFADAAEGRRVIADLGGGVPGVGGKSGDPGPFRDFRIEQHRSLLKTRTELGGTVDLSAGLGSFADPDLQAALGGTADAPLGVTAEQLERRLGAALDRLFGLQVAARLPGRVVSNAATETDNGAVWAPALGERIVLEASSEQWQVRRLAFGAVAVAAAVVFVVVVMRGRRRRGVTITG